MSHIRSANKKIFFYQNSYRVVVEFETKDDISIIGPDRYDTVY